MAMKGTSGMYMHYVSMSVNNVYHVSMSVNVYPVSMSVSDVYSV